jgi:hypothetical protein
MLTDDMHGADVLTEEIKEEASRLIHHPVEEMKRLEHVVEEGDSPATLLLLMFGMVAAAVVIGGIAIAAAMLVYYNG